MKRSKSLAKIAAAALVLSLTVTAGAVPPLRPEPVAAADTTKQEPIEQYLQNAPFKKSGQLYLPLKEIALSLEMHVNNNRKTKTIEVTGIQQYAKLQIGKSKAIGKDNKSISLGAPVINKKGELYVPASLFSKLFGVKITVKTKKSIVYSYNAKYSMMKTGNALFWLNTKSSDLYMGLSGQLPKRIGKLPIEDPDWLYCKAAWQIDKSTYVLDINNDYGEPHINTTWYRILIHDGEIVQQSNMSFGGFSQGFPQENIVSSHGQILMNDGHKARLYTPEGQLAETLDLIKLGGAEDTYCIEAIEPDFLLIRPHSKGTLLLIDRKSGKQTPLYLSLLDKDSIERVEAFDFEINDGLKYTGRDGSILKFDWKAIGSKKVIHKTLDMSK